MKKHFYLLALLACFCLGTFSSKAAEQYPDGNSTVVTIEADMPNLLAHVTFKVCDKDQSGNPLQSLEKFEIYEQIGYESKRLIETVTPVSPGQIIERSYPITMGEWNQWFGKGYVDSAHAHYETGASIKADFTIDWPSDVVAKSTHGSAPVNVSFRVPDTDQNGNPLPSGIEITKASLWRDNPEGGVYDVLIGELTEGLQPGQTYTITDEYAVDGHEYYYKVGVEGRIGDYYKTSPTTSTSVLLGADAPSFVENLKATQEQKDGSYVITLTWDVPSHGINNGDFDPESVKYHVYLGNNYGEDLSLISEEDGISETSFAYTLDIDRPANYVFYVGAFNEKTEADNEPTTNVEIIAGPNYTLPYLEGFNTASEWDDSTNDNLWDFDGWGWNPASVMYIWGDDDDCISVYDKDFKGYVDGYYMENVPVVDGKVAGFLSLNYAYLSEPATYFSYNINMTEVTEPFATVDVFQYPTNADAKVEFMARVGNEDEFISLGEIAFNNENKGWVTLTFPMDQFAGKDNVQVAFRYTPVEGAENAIVLVDNVAIQDVEPVIPEFYAPMNCAAAADPENRVITLSWEAPVAPEGYPLKGYNVYVNDEKHNSDLIPETLYTLTDCEDGTYRFAVEAVYEKEYTAMGDEFGVEMLEVELTLGEKAVGVAGNDIIVNAAGKVTVLAADGKVVYNGCGSARVTVENGIYLVRFDKETVKVLVK